jgi:peptidoglycan/LPS O-acetylase OafA/YrhL
MPAQIKYYFIIPIISVSSWRFKHHAPMFCIMMTVIIIFIEFVNPFGREPDDFYVHNGHVLRSRLPLFLDGSLFAVVYFNLKNNKVFCDFIALNWVKNTLSLLLVFLVVFQFKYSSMLWNPKINWTDFGTFKCGLLAVLLLSLMFFSAPNATNDFFSSYFMQKCGQYSFGMYLLQFVVMQSLDKFKTEIFVFLETYTEYLVVNFACLYMVGFLWYHGLEKNFIRMANVTCDRLARSVYFAERQVHSTIEEQREPLV